MRRKSERSFQRLKGRDGIGWRLIFNRESHRIGAWVEVWQPIASHFNKLPFVTTSMAVTDAHNGMWPSACKFTKQVARLIADRGPCLDHGHQKRDFATFQALIVRPSSVGDHNELCLPRVPRYGPMEDQAQPWLRVVNHLQRYGSVEHLRRSR